MEAVGRFPTTQEAEEYSVATDTPVWLPAGSTVGPQFNSDILEKIKLTRKLSKFAKY